MKGDIKATIAALAELLRPKPPSTQQEHPQSAGISEGTPATIQNNVRVKLPKLEVRRFLAKLRNGKNSGTAMKAPFTRIQPFRVSTSSCIFAVFLGEQQKQLFSGLPFTTANYQVAIEVGLPWKGGHGPLPTNFWNSLKRHKGQIERLKNDLDILKVYDVVIKEQAMLGIVERGPELASAAILAKRPRSFSSFLEMRL